MPWNREHLPVSMRHLSEATRDKAIAIANALLAEDMAIRAGQRFDGSPVALK
jgi:uncharacterized protein YdaT